MADQLSDIISDILCGGDHFISGVHKSSSSLPSLLAAVVKWGELLSRDLDEIVAGFEPSIRQSVLMSLIPAQAFDSTYTGSIDKAIQDHLNQLGLNINDEERRVIRDICINVNKLKGLNAPAARRRTASLAELRGDIKLYNAILKRQNGRCLWCGVDLSSPDVEQSLEHVSPKHLGDDPPDGKNWGIACTSCNNGKAESLAWSARPEAHDYISRLAFSEINEIGLPQRWAVLMRSPRCSRCGATSKDTELWVFRRIPTGLPIPVNCSVTCLACAASHRLEILLPKWHPRESRRGKPVI